MSKLTELKKYIATEYQDGFDANIRKVDDDTFAVTFGNSTDETTFLVLTEEEANKMALDIIGGSIVNAKVEQFCNDYVFLGALLNRIDENWLKEKVVEVLEEEIRGMELSRLGREAFLLNLTDNADIALDNRDNPEKIKEVEDKVIEAKLKDMEDENKKRPYQKLPGYVNYLLSFYEDPDDETFFIDDAYRERALDLDDIVEEYIDRFGRKGLLSDDEDEGKTPNYFIYEQW